MVEVQDKVVAKVSLTRDQDFNKGRILDSESHRVDKASKVIRNRMSTSRGQQRPLVPDCKTCGKKAFWNM